MPILGVFSHRKRKQPQERQQAEQAEGLFSTAGAYGLKTLAEANQDTVDIVFVHGLTGNRETTWTHNQSLFWPRDLLAKEFPDARILTFGYDADIVGVLKTAGSNTIRDHGKSLAQDLSMRRTKTHSNDRPIIFVAHSLGGLVVEQALLIARGSSEPHVKPLLHNTVAIAFMGTPHLGSRKADWAHAITGLSNLLRKTNKEIVAVLKPGSEMLANLQQEFHTMLEDRRRNEGKWIDIFCFYEELSYPGIGQIVPRESSILPGYPNISIHNNHSDMTKFSSELDAGYIRVRDQLWLWVQKLNKNREGANTVSEQSLAQAQDTPRDRSTVSSSGGAIFMGNVSAGRDFTYNSN